MKETRSLALFHAMKSPWLSYAAKALLLLAILFLAANVAPQMPIYAIAIFVALISVVSSIGTAYHEVIRKTYKHAMYKEGSHLSRLNAGRVVCLFIAFVVSAFFTVTLVYETAKWTWIEWVILLVAIPLYVLISFLVKKIVSNEYEEFFRLSKTAILSTVILTIVMCAVFAIVICIEPTPNYARAADAFLDVSQPFSNSPSAFMSEIGKFAALSEGLTIYTLSQSAAVSNWLYIILRIVIVAGTFFVYANLLSICSIEFGELKRVFLPLKWDGTEHEKPHLIKRYIVLIVVLVAALIAGFIAIDARVSKIVKSDTYTLVEEKIAQEIGYVVYEFDGKYYDPVKVDKLLESAKEKSAALSQEAKDTLVPLINASFDKRIENVDSYLDWYYSLGAEYERLANMVTGEIENYVQSKFTEKIESGIDDSELSTQISYFITQSEELRESTLTELSKYELSDDIPDYLISSKVKEIDITVFDEALEPTQSLTTIGERLGISTAAGVVSGVIAKKLVKKIVEKTFYKTFVKKINNFVATKAAGAAAGGAVGSSVPVIGTVVGTVVGTAVGVGVDYGLLKLDEKSNRSSYRDEIVEMIESERSELLAAVQES